VKREEEEEEEEVVLPYISLDKIISIERAARRANRKRTGTSRVGAMDTI